MTVSTTARRTLAAAAIAPLLLTGFAACGDNDSDTKDDASSSAHDSSGLQPEAGTLVLADLDDGDQVDPSEFVDTVANGVEASTTAHVTMKVTAGSAGEISGEGDLDYTSEPPEMAMTMAIPMMGDTKAEMRLVDGVFYMSMGQLSQGKFWKIDPDDPNSPLGDLGSMLDQMDPKSSLEKMESSIDTVTYTGEEDVDGRTLDHYELTVDSAKIAQEMGSDLPGGAKADLPDSLTYDLWLDEEDRISKMTMDIPVAGTESSVDMTVSDWGEDVSIEAPPADEVTDMPDLGSLGGSMQG